MCVGMLECGCVVDCGHVNLLNDFLDKVAHNKVINHLFKTDYLPLENWSNLFGNVLKKIHLNFK